jgi:flagellar assembly factor FliW
MIMMKCTSTRFGTFEIKDEKVLTFPSGLLGFPERPRYVILDHDTDAPFKWLQSLEDPALAFVIIDPARFHSSYRVEISPEALAEVQGEEAENLTIAVILTIPSDDPGRITANLRGPLLMNPRTRLCKQLVLSDEFPTRHPLFPVTAPNSTRASQPVPAAECPA